MDGYLSILQSTLTPNRLRHSLGVMGVMETLAPVYGLDLVQARTAGLLHDAAKELTPEQQAQAAQAAGIVPGCEAERDYTIYLHGPVGAYTVRTDYGVDDELVLDAIAAHCFCGSGANFHAPLSWCLRFADILEPNRHWDGPGRAFAEGSPGMRAAAFAGNLQEAALLHVRMTIRFLTENHLPLHPNYPRVQAELAEGRLKFVY